MPRLPTRNDLSGVPLRTSRQVVGGVQPLAEQAGAMFGQAIQGVGLAGMQKAAEMKDARDRLAEAQAESKAALGMITAEDELANDDDYQTIVPRYEERIKQVHASALESVTNPDRRKLLEQKFALDLARGKSRMTDIAGKKETNHVRATLDDTIAANREAALTTTDPVARNRLIESTGAQLEAARAAGHLSDTEAVDLRQRFTQDYALGAAEMLSPAERIQQLSGEKPVGVFGYIPADKRQSIIDASKRQLQADADRARIMEDRNRSIAREDLTYRIQDASAAYLSGQAFDKPPTEQDFRAAFKPEEADRRWQSFKTIQDVSGDIRNLHNASPAEMQSIIDRHKPAATDGFAEGQKMYQVLAQSAQQIMAQRNADPALFVVQSDPNIKRLYEAANDGDSAAAQQYAINSLAEQKRLGIAQPKILPEGTANQIAGLFFDQKEGGKNSAQLMTELKQQWGKAWPDVYKQLARDNKLPPAALVIPNMSDEGSKERLARWSQVPDKVFEERLPNKSADVEDIDSTLREQLAPLWSSLSMQNGGESTYNTYVEQAKKLALGYAADGNTKPKDAAARAYQETIGHAYEFGPSYRVPKTELPAQVFEGAARALHNVDTLDVQPFRSVGGLTDQQAGAATLRTIKENGVWATNSDESGLNLYVEGNNGLNAVRDKSGKQIMLTWQQLRDRGMEVPAWPAQPSRFGGSGGAPR